MTIPRRIPQPGTAGRRSVAGDGLLQAELGTVVRIIVPYNIAVNTSASEYRLAPVHRKMRTHATLTLPGIPVLFMLESLPAEKVIHAGFIVTNPPAIDT